MAIDPEQLAETLGPLAAFVVATFDRSGLPLIIGAVCVAVGLANGSATATVCLGTLGMISGDIVLYEIGRRSGNGSFFKKPWLRPLRPLRANARALLKRYPIVSLMFGRYVAGAGILLPILAGTFGLARRRAWALLTLGSILYVVPWGVAAFYFGNRFRSVVTTISDDVVWIAVLSLVVVIALFAYQRVKRKARKAAALAERENNNSIIRSQDFEQD